jgi:drug/metabolite transporter (DMT)-like permease
VPWPTGAWPFLAVSAAVHGLYLYALVRTYDLADLSAAYPVLRGSAPLFTALLSVALLGEHVGGWQVAGIATLGLGLLTLALGRHITPRALGWAGLTGACIAGYTVIDAQGVRVAPSVACYIAWAFVIMGTLVVFQFALLTRSAVFAGMLTAWRPCMVAGVLSICTYGLALAAFALGPTAPLAALRETGTVTALILGVVVLRERVTRQRAAAGLAVIAGAGMILLGGSS